MKHLTFTISDEHYDYLQKEAEEKDITMEELAQIIIQTVYDLGLKEIVTIE